MKRAKLFLKGTQEKTLKRGRAELQGLFLDILQCPDKEGGKIARVLWTKGGGDSLLTRSHWATKSPSYSMRG